MAREVEKKKARIIVFDPVGTETANGTWPDSADIYSDEGAFIDKMNNDETTHSVVFVDEAAEIFGHQQKENFWMLTRGRHFGLSIIVICQRPKMVHPTVRAQCGRGYIFRLAQDDMVEIGRDFAQDLSSHDLDRGEYLVLDSGKAGLSRHNVFSPKTSKETPP
jgi:DNA helicase HerA-like ATPase